MGSLPSASVSITANTNILIVGGGTGWILEELANIHPSGLNITYVEISANMMALSKKRSVGSNNVVFINNAIENVNLPQGFDVVITPFLFDNFTGQTLDSVFDHIHQLLKSSVIWLNADFQLTGKWWQGILLKTMFVFFKILCNIEASKLPDIEKQFTQAGYQTVNDRTFFNDFIVARVYNR